MTKLDLFKITRREVIWKNEFEQEDEYIDLGVVKGVAKATETVNNLNAKNTRTNVAYFYKDLKLELYKDRDDYSL